MSACILVAVLTSPDLDALIADTEAEILHVIEQAEDERTAALYEMVRYHLGLDRDGPRGKRLRPLLGLLAYESLTGDHRQALPGAAAVELGHNFSLVHDDIEDRDTERRHRPTLWRVYGVAQAVISALGCAPGLGFVHSGHELSFAYDVADLYKIELGIPVAFDVAAEGPEDVGSRTRRAIRDKVNRTGLLDRCVADIKDLLLPPTAGGDSVDGDAEELEDRVTLQSDRGQTVSSGHNYADGVIW
jgi:hypothetical protein